MSARHVEEQITKLKQDFTVVIVTHDLHQARRVADYAIFLYMGKLIESGPTTQIFDSPKEDWTRNYISGEPLNE
jgi:phosphate transport system ATP-binding protein